MKKVFFYTVLLIFLLIPLVSAFESDVYSIDVGVGTTGINVDVGETDIEINITETCTTGQTTCVGTNYYLCVNSHWVNYGNVNGQCGYTMPIGGGGGGGGLGISSVTTSVACSEKWQCSDWSACVSPGVQTRICTDTNKCGTTKNKPAESQDCVLAEQISSTGFLGLTGAAIGNFVKSGEGVATLSGLLTIVVAAIAFFSVRKNKLAKSKNIEIKKE